MKMQKLIAVILTALMTVSPVVMALDLGDYPSFLFEDHNLNAYIVAGADAATADVVGMTNLAIRLAGESYNEVPVEEEEEVVVTGDAYRVDKTTDFLEYDEQLDDVLDIVGESELSGLAGGTFSNNKGSFDYNEYVTLPEQAYVEFSIDPDDETDTPAHYLKFVADKYAYIYKVEFPTALEVDVADIDDQLEDKEITLMGVKYRITDAYRASEDSLKLTLMGGAGKATAEHGETVDLDVEGVTYSVTPSIYSSSEVAFEVSYGGKTESTDTMDEGDTYTLEDGTEIGVSEIRYSAKETVASSVSFYLGAQKLVLEDNEIEDDSAFDEKVVLGTNTLDDTAVKITGSDDGTTLKISTIEIKWTPDDDLYVPEGGKLSDKEDEGEEGQVFGSFDIEFTGVKQSDTEEIRLKPKGDDEYVLVFTNDVGQTFDLPYLDCDAGSLSLGDETHNLFLQEPPNATIYNISKNDYFVVTSGYSSYVLQYRGSDKDDNVLEFKNVATGDTIKITYKETNVDTWHNDTSDATLTLGGKNFDVWVKTDSTDDSDIVVDLNDDGESYSGDEVVIYTKYKAKIDFNVTTLTEGFVLQTEELDDGTYKEAIKVPFTCGSDDAIDLGTIDGWVETDYDLVKESGETDTVGLLQIGDTDNYKEVSRYGVVLEKTQYSDGPDKLTMTYPDDQTEALVYVTTGAEITTTTGGGKTIREVVPIEDVVAVLDTDPRVTDPATAGRHLVLIGDAAVNRLSARVMGLRYPTYGNEGKFPYSEGEGYIKVYEDVFTEGQVVLLVAGWDAEDTTHACLVLQKFDDFQEQLDGNTAVKITSVAAEGIIPAE